MTAPQRAVSNADRAISQGSSAGTGSAGSITAAAAKRAVTVQAAVTAPVVNALVVLGTPPQPLMPVSVKPALALAVQVVVAPNATVAGVQVSVPPPSTTTLVLTGNVLSTKFAVTVQGAVTAAVVKGLVVVGAPPQPPMPPLKALANPAPAPAAVPVIGEIE